MELSSTSKTLKSIHTTTYNVSLLERDNGMFYINYTGFSGEHRNTKNLKDLGVAMHLFNLLREEAELYNGCN